MMDENYASLVSLREEQKRMWAAMECLQEQIRLLGEMSQALVTMNEIQSSRLSNAMDALEKFSFYGQTSQ